MSGKPNPDGVARLLEAVRDYRRHSSNAAEAAEKQQFYKQAYAQSAERAETSRLAIRQLMAEMDIASPYNAGYEGRMLAFLCEVAK